MTHPIAIFWFRRDLRLQDNHGLYRALQPGLPVMPIFIFDEYILNRLEEKADLRVNFIFNTLKELNAELSIHKSAIQVFYGKPVEVWNQLLSKYDIHSVYCNHDYEPEARVRDEKIFNLLQQRGVVFNTFKDQVLFECDDILKPDGKPYTVFTPYSRKWKEALTKLDHIPEYPSHQYLHHLSISSPSQFMTLEEIGFVARDSKVSGPMIAEDILARYEAQRNYPAISGTTRIGIHLRFGTISVRECIRRAVQHEAWLNELIWREFFMMILFHFPYVVTKSFKPKYDQISWRNNENEFERWCQGKTGYDLVDAGMNELNTTGFMHNRVRMVTASFLTKHLLIDWRWGEAYFASKLLDYDLSANNGNWQWAAGCGCDAAPYFRIFNPIEQAKKFDSDGTYRSRWLPGWPLQQVVPVVDHQLARVRALDVYKKALTP